MAAVKIFLSTLRIGIHWPVRRRVIRLLILSVPTARRRRRPAKRGRRIADGVATSCCSSIGGRGTSCCSIGDRGGRGCRRSAAIPGIRGLRVRHGWDRHGRGRGRRHRRRPLTSERICGVQRSVGVGLSRIGRRATVGIGGRLLGGECAGRVSGRWIGGGRWISGRWISGLWIAAATANTAAIAAHSRRERSGARILLDVCRILALLKLGRQNGGGGRGRKCGRIRIAVALERRVIRVAVRPIAFAIPPLGRRVAPLMMIRFVLVEGARARVSRVVVAVAAAARVLAIVSASAAVIGPRGGRHVVSAATVAALTAVTICATIIAIAASLRPIAHLQRHARLLIHARNAVLKLGGRDAHELNVARAERLLVARHGASEIVGAAKFNQRVAAVGHAVNADDLGVGLLMREAARHTETGCERTRKGAR